MIELREFIEQDLEQLMHILNNPEVVKYLSTKIPQPYTERDAQWWIHEGSKLGIIKAISLNGVLVGCIGVNQGQFEYQRSGEIGYWLAKEYWHQGITKLAIEKMLELVFSETQIVRIYAAVFSENSASMKLLLNSGFEQEAVLKKAIYKDGEFYDKHVFARLQLVPNDV